MKKVMKTLIAALYSFVPLQDSYGQQADAPRFKDGDWWKMNLDYTLAPGMRGKMKLSALFILVLAFFSPRPLHAQENRPQFDGEWVGNASPKEEGTCRPGTYQIAIKDSQITGTYDVRVKKDRSFRNDTSNVTGQVGADGKAVLTLTPVDAGARKSKVKGTFTSTEFRGSDTTGRCDYDVQLQRR